MTNMEVSEALRAGHVAPVSRASTTAHTATVAQCLREFRVSSFEVAIAIPDAPSPISEPIRDGEYILGAGTLPYVTTAGSCLPEGARLVLAQRMDVALKATCRRTDAVVMHGALPPYKMGAAVAAGADVVKISLASSVRGRASIKALGSYFLIVQLVPIGGIEPRDVSAHLVSGAYFVDVFEIPVDDRCIGAVGSSVLQVSAREIL